MSVFDRTRLRKTYSSTRQLPVRTSLVETQFTHDLVFLWPSTSVNDYDGFIDNPNTFRSDCIHKSVDASSPNNDFPVPHVNPNPSFYVAVVFEQGWDGGDATVVGWSAGGTGLEETLPAAPGTRVVTTQRFAAVVSGGKSGWGTSSATLQFFAVTDNGDVVCSTPLSANDIAGAIAITLASPYPPFRVTALFRGGWDGGDIYAGGVGAPEPSSVISVLHPPASGAGFVVGDQPTAAITSTTKVLDPYNPVLVGTIGTVELGAIPFSATNTFHIEAIFVAWGGGDVTVTGYDDQNQLTSETITQPPNSNDPISVYGTQLFSIVTGVTKTTQTSVEDTIGLLTVRAVLKNQ